MTRHQGMDFDGCHRNSPHHRIPVLVRMATGLPCRIFAFPVPIASLGRLCCFGSERSCQTALLAPERSLCTGSAKGQFDNISLDLQASVTYTDPA